MPRHPIWLRWGRSSRASLSALYVVCVVSFVFRSGRPELPHVVRGRDCVFVSPCFVLMGNVSITLVRLS